MFQVIVRGPDGAEATHALGVDQGLLFGRDETCDIVLPSKRVSRRHARIFTEGERLYIEDLGSQNGLFVGGARLAGKAEIRPGPPIEIGEFKIRVKKLDPRTVQAADGVDVNASMEARIKGLGDMAGRELPLPRERGFVGRDKTMEVPIENDSVSRKHAELRLEAGALHVVTDLGSSNGTFVNGAQLKPNLPSRLKHGDKVRFGETHWQYLVAGGAMPAAGGLTRKQKLYLGLAVGMVVLFAALKVAHRPSQEVVEEQAGQAADVDDLIAAGQRNLDNERFEDARKAFKSVLEEDPVNSEARQLLRKAERELENEKQFKEGNAKADVGRDAEALRLYFGIDVDSRFFTRARLRVQELALPLMKKDGSECRDAGRHKASARVLEACGRFLDYKCHTGVDDEALRFLREAEKTSKAREGWLCPQKLAPFFGAGGAAGVDPAKEIGARYDDKDVRDAVVDYAKGDIETAIRAVGKVKVKSPVASDVAEQLAIVSGRFKEGDSAARAGRLKEMRAAFDAALAADGKIVPPSVQTFHAREMRTRLGHAFYEAGKALYDKQSYPEAYDQWAKGLEYQRNDTSLLDGLKRLEKVAQDLLASAPNCDDVRKVLHITNADPPSSAHQKAGEMLEQECGG